MATSYTECSVCGEYGENRIKCLKNVTRYTNSLLKEVVSNAICRNIKDTDSICTKCLELFNEKDRLQKMTTDMDSHIQTKIKETQKKDSGAITIIKSKLADDTINIHIGESVLTIKEDLERQFTSLTQAEVNVLEPKKRRGRPPKEKGHLRFASQGNASVFPVPPLMVNERPKRKRSSRFDTYLEVLRGEKEFYIDDEDKEDTPTKRRGRIPRNGISGNVDRSPVVGIVPVGEACKDDDLERMCIIQVTEMSEDELDKSNAEKSSNSDKDKLDLEEVVQEILGLKVEGLIDDIDSVYEEGPESEEHNDNLMNVIDGMNTANCDLDDIASNTTQSLTQNTHSVDEDCDNNNSGNMASLIKVDNIKKESDSSSSITIIKTECVDSSDTSECLGTSDPEASIEVTANDDDEEEALAEDMPRLELTITQQGDNTLSAVVSDQNSDESNTMSSIFTDSSISDSFVKEESGRTISIANVEQDGFTVNAIIEQKKFRCKICNVMFCDRESARDHAQEIHKMNPAENLGSQQSYKCSECDRVFPTIRGRDRHHLHMHLKHKPVQCTVCLQNFNSFGPLERHLRNIHDRDPTTHCELCEAEFVLGTSLEHHREIVHPNSSRISRSGSNFIKSTVSVQKQIKDVPALIGIGRQPKLIQCPFCSQMILGSRALKIHHQKVHNGQEYNCKYCRYRSACLSTVQRHMIRVHKAADVELYSCIKCKAGYREIKDLEEHYVLKHRVEPDQLCQHCGEKFACIEMLRAHKKTHRAFSCHLCQLGFMKEDALEDHINTVHQDDPANNGCLDSSSIPHGQSMPLLDMTNVTTSLNSEIKSTENKDPELENQKVASSKVLEIGSDGSVTEVKDGQIEKISEDSTNNNIEMPSLDPSPSEDVTLHLQQTKEGGLEEMDILNPLKGQRVKDLPKKMECPICNKVLTTKFLRTHMLSHQGAGSLPHKCRSCGKAYAQGTLLRKHIRNRHPEEFAKLGNKNPKKHKVKCDFCEEIYNDIYALEEHLWIHMKEKIYECGDCKIKFGMESNLREHYKSHFFKEEQPCPICKREFKSIGFYNEHVERCKSRWKCEHCGLECDTQEYYRKHQRSDHGGENVIRYQCNLCEKSFVEKHRYEDHLITHSTEKAFTCHICDKQFKRQRPLNDHLARAHSEQSKICSYCHKHFNSSQELEAHKQVHKRDYPCNACGHVYTSKAALLNHLVVHHTEASPHSCHLCGQTFVKQANLKSHLVTHSSSTPYICQADACHKMFRSEALLKSHMARRHNDLEYVCHICDRKFGLDSDLRRHAATHAATPLPCHECSRSFRSEAQLERHLLTHTKEQPYECGICQHTTAVRSHLLRHIQIEHGLDMSEAATQLVVNRWRCSVCGKMFVVRGSLMRHLQEHGSHGVQAQGHSIKTRSSTNAAAQDISITDTIAAAAQANNDDTAVFLDQVSSLSWQDLTPLLRLHVVTDAQSADENDEDVGGTVAADVWQCPGCLHATSSEEDMRDHLASTTHCQEAVILQLAGGLAGAQQPDDRDDLNNSLQEDDSGEVKVLQLGRGDLTESGMGYLIVQEEDNQEGLHDPSSGNNSDGAGEADVDGVGSQESSDGASGSVLVSMDDSSLQQLLHQPGSNIQIVVENAAAAAQLLSDGSTAATTAAEGDTNTSNNSTIQDTGEGGSGDADQELSEAATLLNGSELLLQTADGQLVLQQTINGMTQYQLVEGVPTSSNEDEVALTLLPQHSSDALAAQFIIPE
ncbi:unnamed protein product [Meganyctiphanes norvegica]|uniref:C2H2-type domain-containing protein n=1 Tax=Meganyctiphanes norvegica TaxID=48144 RepID=A0AAV2PM82_MEGNR